MRPPFFPEATEITVPSALLNNAWRIVAQETAITSEQHRDLQNIFALLRAGAVDMEGVLI